MEGIILYTDQCICVRRGVGTLGGDRYSLIYMNIGIVGIFVEIDVYFKRGAVLTRDDRNTLVSSCKAIKN